MNMQQPFGFPNMGMMAPFGVMNKMTLAPALYIGDLDPSIQEEFLYDFFSKFGSIHFVRIMRDNTTGKSRGYGFVNFINPRDAENAKQYAQYEKLGNKHIRIMFKRPIKDLTSEANLYVKNIDPNVNVKELHEYFANHGNVVSAKIATTADGKSLGYAYIQFEKPEDAEKCLETLQNSKLKEKELVLSRFVPKEKRPHVIPKTNLYIKDLPADLSSADLEKKVRAVISKLVPQAQIKTMLVKKHPVEDKYCSFICFEDPVAAQEVHDHLKQNPRIFDPNQDTYVNWHQSKAERERELRREHSASQNQTNLYVKNLKSDVDEETIKKAFQNFGKVTSVAVKEWTSPTGQKSRFGFIAFSNADDAKRAQTEGLQNQDIRGLFLPQASPYINLHQSKEKRSEFLQSQKRRKLQANMMDPMAMGMGGMYPMGMNPMQNRKFPPAFPGAFPQGQRPFNRGPHPRAGPGGPRTGGGGQFGRPNWNKNNMQGGNQHQQQQQQHGHPKVNQNQGGPQHGMKPQMNADIQKKPVQQPQTQPSKPITQGVTVQGLKSKLNEFLQLDEDKQRQILGELLFPLIRARSAENLAPKITGMLIDLSVLEINEILEFLDDPALLQERINEASELLLQNEQ